MPASAAGLSRCSWAQAAATHLSTPDHRSSVMLPTFSRDPVQPYCAHDNGTPTVRPASHTRHYNYQYLGVQQMLF